MANETLGKRIPSDLSLLSEESLDDAGVVSGWPDGNAFIFCNNETRHEKFVKFNSKRENLFFFVK